MFKSLKFLNEGFDRRYLKEEVDEELFHNDNGTDYVIVERSKSGKNALLRTQNGKKWIIAWDCPKSNEGSWGQGHYFFDEHEARDLWEKKYLNEDVRREWKPNINFNHIKDVYNKVKANNYKYVNNEREEMSAAVEAADKGKYTPEQRRQIKEWHREIWSAHRSKTNESIVGNAKNWLIDKEGKTPKEAERIINNSSPEEIEKIALNYTKKNKSKTNEAVDDRGVERYGVNGKWWYFTTHGVQPGSVPKGIKILDTKEGKNKKGTIGTFFASDRVLNTSELNKYDIKEEVPVDESLNEDSLDDHGISKYTVIAISKFFPNEKFKMRTEDGIKTFFGRDLLYYFDYDTLLSITDNNVIVNRDESLNEDLDEQVKKICLMSEGRILIFPDSESWESIMDKYYENYDKGMYQALVSLILDPGENITSNKGTILNDKMLDKVEQIEIFSFNPNYYMYDPEKTSVKELFYDFKKNLSHRLGVSVRYVGNEDELEESLTEDTVKQNGKWVNKGKEGTHGKFATKKAADAQRRAIWVNWDK